MFTLVFILNLKLNFEFCHFCSKFRAWVFEILFNLLHLKFDFVMFRNALCRSVQIVFHHSPFKFSGRLVNRQVSIQILPQIFRTISSNSTTMPSKRESASNLIWVDCEMTGLDHNTDHLLEIAVVVTDKNLNVLAEGPSLVIHQSDEVKFYSHKLIPQEIL